MKGKVSIIIITLNICSVKGVGFLLNLTANDLEILLESLRESWVTALISSENPTAFEGIKRVNENYMFCCPVHKESNPSCGISTKYPYAWHCFSCDASGTVYNLVNTVIRGSIAHAEYFIENYCTLTMVIVNH